MAGIFSFTLMVRGRQASGAVVVDLAEEDGEFDTEYGILHVHNHSGRERLHPEAMVLTNKRFVYRWHWTTDTTQQFRLAVKSGTPRLSAQGDCKVLDVRHACAEPVLCWN